MTHPKFENCGLPCWTAFAVLLTATTGAVAAIPTRDDLVKADYRQGKTVFQQRCSACHTLAEGGSHLVGPNLFGLMKRKAGETPGFNSSEAIKSAGFGWDVEHVWKFIAGPEKLVPGTRMMIPEPVPEQDRAALISFLMLETGAADWPKPAAALAKDEVDTSRPIAERFPSFWNHLMTNTTRYRMVTPEGEVRFDGYFNTDGTVTTNVKSIKGFWNTIVRNGMDLFCYALDGIPAKPSQIVECFPIAAMAIPRFAQELWQSHPTDGVTLHGGIMAGRPES